MATELAVAEVAAWELLLDVDDVLLDDDELVEEKPIDEELVDEGTAIVVLVEVGNGTPFTATSLAPQTFGLLWEAAMLLFR